MDPNHPSEALLPTFGHDRLEVVLVPTLNPGNQARSGVVAGALLTAFGVALAVGIAASGDPMPGVMLGGFIAGAGLMVGAAVALADRRVRLTLGARTLTIVTTVRGRTLRTRNLQLRDVRTAHAVDAGAAQGSVARRGLRIALRDGEELMLAAPAVPVESLQWYAAELRTVAARIADEPEGEVAPELVELLSDESRQRVEAARRAHRAGQRV